MHSAGGRRQGGRERAGDVMNRSAPRRHRFRAEALPASIRTPHHDPYGDSIGQRHLDVFEDRLADNTVSPVPVPGPSSGSTSRSGWAR